MSASALDKLAATQALAQGYYDHRGEFRTFSAEAKAAILQAMGIDTHDQSVVEAAIVRERVTGWRQPLPPVWVQLQGQPMRCELRIPASAATGSIGWQVICENGAVFGAEQQLAPLEVFERGSVDGEDYLKLCLPLSEALPLGYHRLTVSLHAGVTATAVLIVAPPHCYEPPEAAQGHRYWGLAIQLYTLRSADNWGVGDFGDLLDLIRNAAPHRCALLGLNPLHALRPADPRHISPYSPSSRQFLNILYIAVPRVPEFDECEPAQRYVHSEGVQARLRTLRAADHVDYVGVAELKLSVLKLLHGHFRKRHLAADDARAAAFREFVAQRGEALTLHALYDALDRRFSRREQSNWGWPSWPEAYRDPRAAAPQAFLRECAEEVEFFQYAQWLAEQQLVEAQIFAREQGMPLGLYGDVAVGVNPNGAESWSNQALYLHAVSIGAPPDPLALKGQDWGIPPQNPPELVRQAYAPFIAMLRANMRAAGALRLDHVMALCRLWWVPSGFQATDGVYMRYPLDDLLAIVALESLRHHCVVIGEDLGTVPDEMRAAMERYGLYHYKVLLFEKDKHGCFNPPPQYVRRALAAVTTHDLPPLKSWWQAQDIELRVRLHLYPDLRTLAAVRDERDRDRRALMHALADTGLWYRQPHEPLPEYSHALMRAVHLYLGLSNSALLVVQLEELLAMSDPVNVPGTNEEYPNWRRKLSDTAQTMFGRAETQEVLRALERARRGENPNR